VTFPTPLIAKDLQVTEITPGTGQVLADGDFADFQTTIWVAETGEYLTGTSFVDTQPSRMDVGPDSNQLGPLLTCATVGSRIAAVSTLAQLFPDVDPAQAGIDADANLVVVVDVTGGFAGKADGVDQLPKSGFPSVVTAPNGTPGVTIPNSAAPTTLESAVLKQGDGDVVTEGDYVTFHYEGLIWDSPGSVFDSSWTDNAPTTTVASAYDDSTQTGVFPGTDTAIIGQKVGSQVIVIVPPGDSYATTGDTAAPDSVPAGSTRIYVIDILSTTPAS
jgi:peptidylprolyl isomerase